MLGGGGDQDLKNPVTTYAKMAAKGCHGESVGGVSPPAVILFLIGLGPENFLKNTVSFCMVLFWKNVEIFGKTAVFLGGYGRIEEIPHRQIWPDWRL